MPHKHYFWHRQPVIDEALLRHFADHIGPGKLVVDVGAGYDPWPYANEFVDYEAWPQLAGKRVHALDVELDRLPYPDKSVDFIYCRHTIEDLHNPTLLLREMNRVAKAGYIETPSPLAEFCIGINRAPGLRGYIHHHWFSWTDKGSLRVMPKASSVQVLKADAGLDEWVANFLRDHAAAWNTYLPWAGSFEFSVLRHRIDFDYRDTYADTILRCLDTAPDNAEWFLEAFGIAESDFVAAKIVHEYSQSPHH